MTLRVTSVLPRGNGAAVVHRQLASAIDGYRLSLCSPWEAAIPAVFGRTQRAAFASGGIAHVVPDCGVGMLPDGMPCVATFHNLFTDDEYLATVDPVRRLYYRLFLRSAVRDTIARANRLVAVSRYTADLVRRTTGAGGIEVILNGVDTTRFSPGPRREAGDGAIRLLFVGNPTRRKGFDLVLQLADALPANCTIHYTSGLRDVSRASPHPRLRTIPWTPHDDMPRVYRDADVLLFPTRREGLSLAVLEAMACGLPVVSLRTSSLPEQVDDGRGGYLLAPGDRDGLLAAIRRLAGDAALRADMGAWNRARAVAEFDQQRMFDQYRALFSSLAR